MQNATADGNDRFIWTRGHGNDTIDDHSTSLTELDTLRLTDVSSNEVSLMRVNGTTHLTVNVLLTGENILAQYRFYSSTAGHGTETIEFSDGVIWDLERILANTAVNGTSTAEVLTGTSYGDWMLGSGGNDTLNGGTGDDTLDGGLGAHSLNGDAGADIVIYTTSLTAVQVNLAVTTAQICAAGSAHAGDILVSIEEVRGSAYGDYLVGNATSNDIWGLTGDDILGGGDGYDRIYGGATNNYLVGGKGADLIDGGIGVDTFHFADCTIGNDAITGLKNGRIF